MMGTALSVETRVGDIVTQKQSRARILEQHRIDYCCGGKVSLAEACAKKGINADQVLSELVQHDETTRAENNPDSELENAPLGDLIDNIVTKHHNYLRVELPRLLEKGERVARVHGHHHPETIEILDIYRELKDELEEHMDKEENVLFPWIRGLETGQGTPPFPGMKMDQPIACMEHDHDKAGAALESIRELTNDYTCPPDACNTFRVYYAGLQELEQDMHIHVHKENSILFPRALAASK